MKKYMIIALSAALLPVSTFAQTTTANTSATATATVATTTTTVDPGILPSSPFYFLDRLNEALQEFFTFDPQAKARLNLQFANERLAEISAMLKSKNVDAPGIDVARARLTDNLNNAKSILADEKNKGTDVSTLSNDLQGELKAEHAVLNSSIKDAIESASTTTEATSTEIGAQELKDLRNSLDSEIKGFDDEVGSIEIEHATDTRDNLGENRSENRGEDGARALDNGSSTLPGQELRVRGDGEGQGIQQEQQGQQDRQNPQDGRGEDGRGGEGGDGATNE